jgi:hypothetical protein
MKPIALVLLLIIGLLSACSVIGSEPIRCPAKPWLAEFQLYEEAISAPTKVDLVVSTPQTGGPCGPGFTLQGVNFFVNGELLGEGVVTRRYVNNDPEWFVFSWNVIPGQNGIPVSGSAVLELSAALVTSEGIKDGSSGLLEPSSHVIKVAVTP